MRSALKIFLFITLPILGNAQSTSTYLDSMHIALGNAANDTIRLEISRNLGFYYQDSEPEAALPFHESQLKIAKKLNFKLWEADAYQQIAYCNVQFDNLPAAYENYMLGLRVAEDSTGTLNGWGYANFSYSKGPREARQAILGMIHYELSRFYDRTRQYEQARYHIFKALQIGETLGNQKILSLCNRDIGVLLYALNNKPDSAFLYFKKALAQYKGSPYQRNKNVVYGAIGNYYAYKEVYDSARFYYVLALNEIKDKDYATASHQAATNQALGKLYEAMGQLDSALVYTLKGQSISETIKDYFGLADGYINLASIYQAKNHYALAYDYSVKGKKLADSLNEAYITRLMQFQNLSFDQKNRLLELERKDQEAKTRIRMYALGAGLFTFLLVALLLYRNNRLKQRTNKILEGTLSDLKATQNQLIQSEKMASLGELTAGIAHEIQNPLNFVNNFSEVNKELAEELEQEVDKGNMTEVKALAKDIKENQEKILHHGKRADGIVKGMLQHSRASSGQKELTDINELCDEYLRLSYHGLRAKDKSFNATFKADLDSTVGKVSIVPQDIGRVVLNLLTNAFYAVNEKKKVMGTTANYEPTVTVTTKSVGGKVVIKVHDNGNGIPENITRKIFQPFFTTKPSGQGTGLGLSLSYDIVTNGHSGNLTVESREGEGSTFILVLPVE